MSIGEDLSRLFGARNLKKYSDSSITVTIVTCPCVIYAPYSKDDIEERYYTISKRTCLFY